MTNKEYQLHEEEILSVHEPAVAYNTTFTADDYIACIPVDKMRRLAEFAITECEAGRCISHEYIKETLKQRMGWV